MDFQALSTRSVRTSGQAFEKQAQLWLETQGLEFVCANFRSKMGEIDLVMRDRSTLVFVEVRQRSSNVFGGAIASVDWKKQNKLRRTATLFLRTRWPSNALPPCRFDVMAIESRVVDSPNGQQPWYWIKNAF